jgi:ferritin
MQFDLYVWPADRALGGEAAARAVARLAEDDPREAPLDPRLAAFADELRAPGGTPFELHIHDRHVLVGIVRGDIELIGSEIADAAWRHGLAVFDPQRGVVALPGDLGGSPLTWEGIEAYLPAVDGWVKPVGEVVDQGNVKPAAELDTVPSPATEPARGGTPMISEQATKLLVAQIAHELGAHQTYMGIALHFERQSLKGWAKLFHEQSVEEAGHATKIMEFLIDNEVAFNLPKVAGAPTSYATAREAVETALASELRVTGQFDALAGAARDAGDHRTLQFLQWFIEEQVEEERTMHALLDLIDSGINLFQAEAHLDVVG